MQEVVLNIYDLDQTKNNWLWPLGLAIHHWFVVFFFFSIFSFSFLCLIAGRSSWSLPHG
jgi:hypothetical protein